MSFSARFGFGLALFSLAAMAIQAQGNRPHAFMERPLSVASENSRVAEALQRAKERPGVVRNGIVGVDPGVFSADSVALNLFSNVKAVVVLTNRQVLDGRGRGYPKTLYTGHIADETGSDVVLFVRPNGSVSGRISTGGKVYTIDPANLSDNSHVVTEYDATQLPPESEPIPVSGG